MPHAAANMLLKWYLMKLRTHPLLTNVSAAFVLMSTGDVMAQQIEQQQQQQPPFEQQQIETEVSNSKVVLLRHSQSVNQQLQQWTETTTHTNISSIDIVRTGTMAAWAGVFYAPFFLGLYKMFDRYLPKQRWLGIGTRVSLSFLVSIPVNAAFYVYGSLAQHLVQYGQDIHRKSLNGNHVIAIRNTPFEVSRAMRQARDKMHQELYDTIYTSAGIWVPFNMLNFSVVPPQYRPVMLLFGMAGWNCYLSMSQHRPLLL